MRSADVRIDSDLVEGPAPGFPREKPFGFQALAFETDGMIVAFFLIDPFDAIADLDLDLPGIEHHFVDDHLSRSSLRRQRIRQQYPNYQCYGQLN